jgi:inosine-uridine nucleoside N-ribohydrolase
MKNRFLIHITFSSCLIMLMFFLSCNTQEESGSKKSTLKVIYDGDIGPDPCDFTTLAMLHNYHKKGMIELLGFMGETPDQYLPSVFSVFNQFYGNDIPIATFKNPADTIYNGRVKILYDSFIDQIQSPNVNKFLTEKYGKQNTLTYAEAPGAVDLYRKLLSEAEDNSVTIYAAGQLYNLPPLFESQGDQYSPLNGKELIKKKVKDFVFMGGHFPTSVGFHPPEMGEWNWWALGYQNITKNTLNAIRSIQKPIVYVGYEVGEPLYVGNEIMKRLGKDHPVYDTYASTITYSSEKENSAFDEVALYYLVEGGLDSYFGLVNGKAVVDENGVNYWSSDASNESYLTLLPGVTDTLRSILTDRITGDF